MKIKWVGVSIAALSLMATTLTAEAADIPRPVYKGPAAVVAYYNWTGFYVGINAGYGWATSYFEGGVAAGTSSDPPPVKPKGFVIGGTLGYNYQIGSWVFGIEGDLDWSTIKGTNTAGNPPCSSCEVRNNWFGTIRGRVGYAFDRFLPYVTGGLAIADLQVTSPLGATQHWTRTGYSIGAGLEYAFTGSWTVKGEFLYNDYGMPICSAATCGFDIGVRYLDRIFRIGLNYKFSGPIFSRY